MALPFATNYTLASLDLQTQKISSFPFKFQPQIGLSFRPANISSTNNPFSPLHLQCIHNATVAVVSSKSWDKMVLQSDGPVLVEFYASWCGPCRMVHRVIDEIAAEYTGKIKCFLVDADNDLQVAENYDIKAVPVVLLFKNGQQRESVIGTMPKEFYVAAIHRVLAS